MTILWGAKRYNTAVVIIHVHDTARLQVEKKRRNQLTIRKNMEELSLLNKATTTKQYDKQVIEMEAMRP